MAPLMSVHSDGRISFCTVLKPLQSSSPTLGMVELELEPELADTAVGVAACAGRPLVHATPNNSAAALVMPRSTLDLDLCTFVPSEPVVVGYL